MGLSTTLNIAQTALSTNAALSSILSRNIAGVNDPDYSVKTGEVVTQANGAAAFVGVRRAANDALFGNLLTARSAAASSQALSDGLDQLEQTVNLTASSSSPTAASDTSTTNDTSPASGIGDLVTALGTFATAPSDTASAQAALTSASDLARRLNDASSKVQAVRLQADQATATSVANVNSLLAQFASVNTQIMQGTATGQDVSDLLDSRNKILGSLSQEMGITTASQPNGGMSIYTDGGVTLFQGTARTVSFASTASFAAGSAGNAVMVDGVPVTGSSAVMALKSGKIAGLATLRDSTTVTYQAQLDQIAGSLIDATAETDSGSGATVGAGLFTAVGGVTLPAGDATGLAAAITINPAVDPSQGGNLTRLRDGGIAGGTASSTTNGNTTGASGYSGYIDGLVSSLTSVRNFDTSTAGSPSGTIQDYASSSVSWLERQRQDASAAASDQAAVVTQTTTSLSNATGVNLDDQLSQMLDLEHSYQASAQLITTVKSMMDSLLAAVQ